MTRIYLIRHAEAEGNIYRRAHGHINGQIIGRGFIQIEQLKERFRQVEVSAVYSSDLYRARLTATAVAGPKGLSIETTDRLREVKMGVWEDESWGNLEYRYPEMSRLFGSDPARWRVDGGEEFAHVQARMMSCIRDIAKRHDGEAVAVFSHGFAIRSFMCGLSGLQSHESYKVPYCDNTAVALLEYENGRLSIKYQGDNSHLDSDTSTFAHQSWWREDKVKVSENLRFEKFDPVRDQMLMDMCSHDTGVEFKADKQYAAFRTNDPAGLIGFDTEGEDAGQIKYICMIPELRRMNYGVQLIGQAVSELRKSGVETVRIKIPAGSDEIIFFLRYGFTKTSEFDTDCLLEKNIRNW